VGAQPTVADRDAIIAELERIIASPQFERSERLIRFLHFVCEQALEGNADELKETVIGTAVFDRPPDYDPKLDSIVRKEANRLRARLNIFYQATADRHQIRIELPKGGYVPVFHFSIGAQQVSSATHRPLTIWAICASVVLLVAAAWITAAHFQPRPIRIAVLPFENQTGDSSQEYFTEGLSSEIHHTLSTVEGLQVIGRTSSFSFRGSAVPISQIAQALHADYVLSGTVRRQGSRISVRAELTRSDDLQMWPYGATSIDPSDILNVQEEMARSLVNRLRLKFGNLRRRYDSNPEIYDEYWKARYYVDPFRAPEAERAIPLLEDILKKDPGFAPAYACLTEAYLSISFNSVTPAGPRARTREFEQKMFSAAEKALHLDPLLPQAYSAMGFVLQRDYKWKDAERSFRRALDLDPNLSEAFYGLGFAVYTKMGEYREGERILRSGLRVDPLSSRLQIALMQNLSSAGRCGEAFRLYRELRLIGNPVIARCFVGHRQVREGLAMLERTKSPGLTYYALAMAGRADDALEFELRHQSELRQGDLFDQFMFFAARRDADEVVARLTKEYEAKDPGLPFHLNWPEFAFLQNDSRFRDLRRRTALSDVE